jgi:predicted phosphodiesterase
MYEGEISNPYFLCDVEELIRSRKPTLWIHGHTHKSRDYRIEDTRVVCNPFGYVAQEENEDFDSFLTVEVDSG